MLMTITRAEHKSWKTVGATSGVFGSGGGCQTALRMGGGYYEARLKVWRDFCC